jgi:hypothetical protein
MPSELTLDAYRSVQRVAKEVLADLESTICADDTEYSIALRAHEGLCSRGVSETWYYTCPAFVLLGARSCLSISGRDYVPALERVGQTNLVTVDLSPMKHGAWGDCARSFIIEGGRSTQAPTQTEFIAGRQFLNALHTSMQQFVTPRTSFHQLFEWTNAKIGEAHFQNLDFAGNVGHSIATRREDQQYIECGNHRMLADVPFFTFEPHVRAVAGRWGFKHENIFFFDSIGRLEEL